MKIAAVALAAVVGAPITSPASAESLTTCETYRITGYVRGDNSPWTYDGTSVWTREPIAAASWNLPINTLIEVQGLGAFRIADRGGRLGPRHIDVLVDTVKDARAVTGWRTVCVLVMGKGRTVTSPKPTVTTPPKSTKPGEPKKKPADSKTKSKKPKKS